jgi:hypothetical protein
MTSPVLIVASRQQSSMVSTWTEYLCLQRGGEGGYKLFTGQYEVLAERTRFFNEDTGEYDVPDEVKGQAVVGTEDDYVVGGELIYFDDLQAVSFSRCDEKTVADWIELSGWSDKADAALILRSLGKV